MGTELRSFNHFQILRKIAYLDHSRKLEKRLIFKFFFIHCNAGKAGENDQIQMYT